VGAAAEQRELDRHPRVERRKRPAPVGWDVVGDEEDAHLHLDAPEYDAGMRTTIDLDPDVDARLRAVARERKVPLRVVINDALRAGVGGVAEITPYTMPSRRIGFRPEINLDKALRLAAELEDQEILRKIELGK